MQKRRSLLVSLLLTLFMPGGGHLYLGAYARGVIVMLLFWTGLGFVVAGLTGFDYRLRISESTTLGFRATGMMARVYLVEIILVYLYNFVDCIRLISATESTDKDKPLYHLTLSTPEHPTSTRKVRQPSLLIGRSSTADLCIDDPAVSREHTRIDEQEGRFILRDLDSRNGTLVNGEPIQQTTLRSGDVIQIGGCRILFRS